MAGSPRTRTTINKSPVLITWLNKNMLVCFFWSPCLLVLKGLQESIRKKRLELKHGEWILSHYNTPTYNEFLTKKSFTKMKHPPDFSPSPLLFKAVFRIAGILDIQQCAERYFKTRIARMVPQSFEMHSLTAANRDRLSKL